ncbi:MAG: acylphosphatase [Chloroflexi bacterium]|nr:acylphosphatase [Chloroflexota bacterium]
MANRSLHATIHGRVQMVGFRYFVLGHANRLGLTGWVRNGAGGQTVEVVAEGDQAALDELAAALRQGPTYAVVDSVESDRTEETQGFSDFTVQP